MSRKAYRLYDFVDRLRAIELEERDPINLFARSSEALYDYLHSMGIEHCNFGVFELVDGVAAPVNFAGSKLAQGFLEEYHGEGMEKDDYVLLSANALTPDRPVAQFDIGRDLVHRLPDQLERSAYVQNRCADHGIEDGVAYIGRISLSDSMATERYFGFVYAGDEKAGEQARANIRELRLATHAFMDRCGGVVEAAADDFGYNLTPREREMLAAIASGEHRAEIAERTQLSLSTVDLHLKNMRRKLGAQTLAQAVAMAFRYRLL